MYQKLGNQLCWILVLVILKVLCVSGQSAYYFCEDDDLFAVPTSSSSEFYLRSPGYGNGTYENNQYCAVALSSGSDPLVLTLYFTEFYLEENYYCSWDYLCIHGVKFCGSWLTGLTLTYILREFSVFTLVFSSDISVTYSGFEILVGAERANYSQSVEEVTGGVGSSPLSIVTSTVTYDTELQYNSSCYFYQNPEIYYVCPSEVQLVYVDENTDPFFIYSHDGVYYYLYGNNLNCSLVLRSGDTPLILQFYYYTFYVEYEESCDSDYLCVYGVPFCGSWPSYTNPLSYILPANSDFTIRFKTDFADQDTGFQIYVTSQPAITTVQEVVGGVGSDPENVITVELSYETGFPYVDRCSLPPPPICDVTPEPYSETYTFCTPYCGNNVIDVNASSPTFLLQTDNSFNGRYQTDRLCSVVIKSGAEPVVLNLYYLFFDLEFQQDCIADNLCVNGVFFCGKWLNGQTYSYILPAYSDFTIVFFSDGQLTKAGFQIIVSVDAVGYGQTVKEIVGGIGTSENNLVISPVTFLPGFNYTDGCADTNSSEVVISSRSVQYFVCDNSGNNLVELSQISSPVVIGSHPSLGQENYENSQTCSLVLASGDDPLVLQFNFSSFGVQASFGCLSDSVCINGVPYCGTWLSGTSLSYFLPAHSTFTLAFVSDDSLKFAGFQAIVSWQEASNDQVLEVVTGGVGSNLSEIVRTNITYSSGLEYLDRCQNYPDNRQPVPLLILPPDDFVPAYIYKMCNCSEPNEVEVGPDYPPFYVDSPNFGEGFYPEYLYCPFTFRSADEPVILNFRFNHFQVEGLYACPYDWLCVNGVYFCDNWLTGVIFQFLLPENSTFTILFKTDGYDQRNGYRIEVSQESAYDKLVAEPAYGSGSSPYYLYYSSLIYYPGIYYQDRCLVYQRYDTVSTEENLDLPPKGPAKVIPQIPVKDRKSPGSSKPNK